LFGAQCSAQEPACCFFVFIRAVSFVGLKSN
jgi:hypothetical protein